MFINNPGKIILFGSGESTPQAIRLLWKFFNAQKIRQRIAILETPAGFQPNSSLVAEEIAKSYQHSLASMIDQIDIIPARSLKDPTFSSNNPTILEPLKFATSIFLGPGSPTYAVSQLQNSLALQMVIDQWQKGSSLIFSSAATLAVGSFTLPVYEIYKVGSPLHWVKGLDVLKTLLPNATIVGHWDNMDGGEELDTSHCYVGEARFLQLQKLLPADTAVFGIDEHTAVIIDPEKRLFMPLGLGSAYRFVENRLQTFDSGKVYSLDSFELITDLDQDDFFKSMEVRENPEQQVAVEMPSPQIQELIDARTQARQHQNFALADELRQQLNELGYQVEDTPQGQSVKKLL